MEKTGCKTIFGTPTTLVVKELMMMMMMMITAPHKNLIFHLCGNSGGACEAQPAYALTVMTPIDRSDKCYENVHIVTSTSPSQA